MARKISFPFYAFRLHFTSGNNLLVPINDQRAAFYNESLSNLASSYAKTLEKSLIDSGAYDRLLKEMIPGDFRKSSIQIELPEAPDGFTYPSFAIEVDYFVNQQNQLLTAIVPAIGVETNGKDEVELEQNLEQQIQLELKRNSRIGNIHRLLSAMWFDQIELLRQQVDITVYDPWEDRQTEDKEKSWLDKIGDHLTGLQDRCYGREKELNILDRYLRNQYNRNLLIVGPNGVGKTALLKELLQRKGATQVYGPFWETTASQMIKELTRETGWEDKIAYLIQDWKEKGARLFVQNLLELFEIGQYEGNAVSVAQYLLPYLTRGEISLISECTPEERSKIETRSPNFLGAFQILELEEPNDQLEEIIQKKVTDIGRSKERTIEPDAISEVVRINRRYEPYAGFPGRPIRFLENLILQPGLEGDHLKRSSIIEQFSQESGMPQFMIDPEIPMHLHQVRSFFADQLFGQNQAIDQLVNLLASIKAGLTEGNKPIASLLFVGPTGVGKTELAKLLSHFMFGDRNRMIRFDMSEYSNPMSVSRLTHRIADQDGILTSAVRRTPFTVLLFDEIEKAHVDFFDLLLQILGEGRLTDSQGQLVNFCSTIIIMTSNIGATALQNQPISPTQRQSGHDLSDHFQRAVKNHFRPELVNRIDQIIPFRSLDESSIQRVVERELSQLLRREGIRGRRLETRLSEEVIPWLGQNGYSKKYGARYLQRIMQEQLATPLAKILNQSDIDDQLIIQVGVENDKMTVESESDPLGLDLLFEELEKINLADFSSNIRRQVQDLKNGNYFIRLLSELDILEREKERNPDAFWASRKKTERYHLFHKMVSAITPFQKEIESIEENLALCCLEQAIFQTEISNQIDIFLQHFWGYKIQLYQLLHPKVNSCKLGVYGKPQTPLLFYLDLLKGSGFEIKLVSVWQGARSTGKEYLYQEMDYEKSLDPAPPSGGQSLIGFELQIDGDCALPYLRPESGVHLWKEKESDTEITIIKAMDKKEETPPGLIKSLSNKEEAHRRVITPTSVKDSKMGINREADPGTRLQLIAQKLDAALQKKIDTALQ